MRDAEGQPHAVTTYDISAVEADAFERRAWYRGASLVMGLAFLVFVAGLLTVLVVGTWGAPVASRAGLGATVLFVIFGFFAAAIAYTGWQDYRRRGPREVLLAPDEVQFRPWRKGSYTVVLNDRYAWFRIADYRTIPAGQLSGAPCSFNPDTVAFAIPGSVCDAIIQVARAHGLDVSTRPLRLASLAGKDRGTGLLWRVGESKGHLWRLWTGK